jgi:hypothetical protein
MSAINPAAAIQPNIRLPELLMRFPQARAVLDRHGLHGCGGAHGPAESLRFFARAHGVDEALLLDEVRRAAAIGGPAAQRLPSWPVQANVDDAIYRRFFTAAIVTVLTAGATWGAWMLWKIGIAHRFTGVSIFEVNAHGHAQIYGWVGLFIMGFAYQAFPRKWQTRLVAPNLAVAAFVTMMVGLIAKTIGLYAPGTSWGAAVAASGGAAEVVASTIFAVQIYLTFQRSMARLDPWVGFVLAALCFFIAQAAFDLWHSWTTMRSANDPDRLLWYVATYQAPLRDLQIHGTALLIILGVNQRLLPGIYTVKPVPRRRAWAALAVLVGAVLGEIDIFIAYRWTNNHAIAALLLVPWAMLMIGVGMIALPWRLWRPLVDVDGQRDRSGKFIRTAYAWLTLSLVMLLMLPLYQWVSGIPFSHAYYGAIRHAITVGFISLMIMGFAAKVVPTLNGVDPRSLTRLWGPFVLINLGCFLRVSLQTLTDWQPAAYNFVGISGMLEVTALAWWGAGLIRIMRAGKRATANEESLALQIRPSQIAANHRVAQVLEWFPAAGGVFANHGFAGVLNPILRRTVARQVTIAQAAAMHGAALDQLLHDLNAAAGISVSNCDSSCGSHNSADAVACMGTHAS